MIDSAIAWMEAHDKLSGWVQAIGVIVAIVAAYVIARVQGRDALRYALRHDARREAERVRSLARIFLYWRDICAKSYAIREAENQGKSLVYALHLNLSEFNYTASEINKFNFVDAPTEGVLGVMSRYREMCGPLSNYMSPDFKPPLPADELNAFRMLIAELGNLAATLMAEADRLGR
jgi:hypothetical protein